MSSEFEKLAAELEMLAKAQPATEEAKVLAAAKEAGVDTDQVGEKSEDVDDKDDLGDLDDDGDEVLGKSYTAVDAAGQSVKAYDATDLIKSMQERLGGLEQSTTDDADRREHLGKSLNLITDLIKSHSDQIETLQRTIVNLSNQGAGRRAVLTVNEKPEASMVKSAPAMNTETFMMKANSAFAAGRISGKDLTVCDVSLRHGEAIDAGLLNRIFES